MKVWQTNSSTRTRTRSLTRFYRHFSCQIYAHFCPPFFNTLKRVGLSLSSFFQTDKEDSVCRLDFFFSKVKFQSRKGWSGSGKKFQEIINWRPFIKIADKLFKVALINFVNWYTLDAEKESSWVYVLRMLLSECLFLITFQVAPFTF